MKRVFVIDDDRLVRLSVKRVLEESGFEVTVASGGEEALELFPLLSYDLILTDIRMPGMSGLEVLEALRQINEYDHKNRIPEMVLTAYNDNHVLERAQEMGVKDYLLKPFDIDVFLDKVRVILGSDSL